MNGESSAGESIDEFRADTGTVEPASLSSPESSGATGKRRPRRRRRVGLMIVGLVVVALVAAEVFVFIRPPHDDARPVDVVAVLGGNAFLNRLHLGIDVASERPGSTLLISLGDPSACPWRTFLTHIHVTCFHADPATTRGEAEYVAGVARTLGAKSVAVVVSADQLLRAQLRFERCLPGVDVEGIESSASLSSIVRHVPYQNLALAKALVLERSC